MVLDEWIFKVRVWDSIVWPDVGLVECPIWGICDGQLRADKVALGLSTRARTWHEMDHLFEIGLLSSFEDLLSHYFVPAARTAAQGKLVGIGKTEEQFGGIKGTLLQAARYAVADDLEEATGGARMSDLLDDVVCKFGTTRIVSAKVDDGDAKGGLVTGDHDGWHW